MELFAERAHPKESLGPFGILVMALWHNQLANLVRGVGCVHVHAHICVSTLMLLNELYMHAVHHMRTHSQAETLN